MKKATNSFDAAHDQAQGELFFGRLGNGLRVERLRPFFEYPICNRRSASDETDGISLNELCWILPRRHNSP